MTEDAYLKYYIEAPHVTLVRFFRGYPKPTKVYLPADQAVSLLYSDPRNGAEIIKAHIEWEEVSAVNWERGGMITHPVQEVEQDYG